MQLSDKLKADPRYVEALAKRGVTDLENIQVDPWPAGNFGLESTSRAAGCAAASSFYRERPDDNGYAHPIEGVVAFVDYDTWELVELIDGDVVPVPEPPRPLRRRGRDRGRPRAPFAGARSRSPSPTGPASPSTGNVIRGSAGACGSPMHPLEGLVLHQVPGTTTTDRLRPILHRAALGEMVVPYGATRPTTGGRTPSTPASRASVGAASTRLELGCDCLGEIRYLDAVLADEHGDAATIAQRHLHPRGGLRHPLEALRHAQPTPPRCAGRGGWWSARSTRSATTSTASTGTSTSTAPSSCEVKLTGHPPDPGRGRRRGARARRR